MPVVPRSSSDDKSSSDNTAGIHKTSVIVGVVFTVLVCISIIIVATLVYARKRRAGKATTAANSDCDSDVELGDMSSSTENDASSTTKPKIQPIITNFSLPSNKSGVQRPDVDYVAATKGDAAPGGPVPSKAQGPPKSTTRVTSSELHAPHYTQAPGFFSESDDEDSNRYSLPFSDSTPRHSWLARATRKAQRHHRRTLKRKSTASTAGDGDRINKPRQPRQTSPVLSTKVEPESDIVEQAQHFQQKGIASQPRLVTIDKPKKQVAADHMVDVAL